MQPADASVPTDQIRLVECPRDAMQGWRHPIPTALKIAYLRVLLQLGFDTLDFGSFVSRKAMPQMADTHEVIQALEPNDSPTRLLAIVANERGALEALGYPSISVLGFPFSLSQTFQQRNTHASQQDAELRLLRILEHCDRAGRDLVVYLSMGFGNPYGDPYAPSMVLDWVGRLSQCGIKQFSLADTVGLASPEQVHDTFLTVREGMPGLDLGLHLHARPQQAMRKLESGYRAGCRRFDSALGGFGGCPMANDVLVGNLATETVLDYMRLQGRPTGIDARGLKEAHRLLAQVFV